MAQQGKTLLLLEMHKFLVFITKVWKFESIWCKTLTYKTYNEVISFNTYYGIN